MSSQPDTVLEQGLAACTHQVYEKLDMATKIIMSGMDLNIYISRHCWKKTQGQITILMALQQSYKIISGTKT